MFSDNEFNLINQDLIRNNGQGLLSFTKSLSTCSNSTVSLEIANTSNEETVKIAPFLLVRTNSITPIPQTTILNCLELAGGGIGQYRYAYATLAPFQEKMSAALIASKPASSSQEDFSGIDFLLIAPGEKESILSFYDLFPGYTYDFQIGIYYSFKGEKLIKWIDESFKATGVTNTVRMWRSKQGLVQLGDVKTNGDFVVEDFRKKIAIINRRLQEEPFFIIDKTSYKR